ncbi:hypothetical protein Tb10.05.0130 [Trypanosoma brucei brucei TREU927]|uniref:Uncharacterized protein n=1 Tax=Trypanosoma brucei brucei (strain 927/4 GUTat10.1) TaxID=185431 RepID=Q388Q7_TRYB2|nr:hypothetical protein Tb10.05.0130 [Trypanosoma brucei brucei TREU927]EAN78713.1 hypothetical protein Tb10.05.0130 [Trypanosoma brucei brucei TREU927]
MNQLSHKKDQSSNATDYKRGTLYLLFYIMRHVSSIFFFLLPFILSFSPPHFPLLFCQCVAQSGPALAVKKKQKVYGVAFFFFFVSTVLCPFYFSFFFPYLIMLIILYVPPQPFPLGSLEGVRKCDWVFKVLFFHSSLFVHSHLPLCVRAWEAYLKMGMI